MIYGNMRLGCCLCFSQNTPYDCPLHLAAEARLKMDGLYDDTDWEADIDSSPPVFREEDIRLDVPAFIDLNEGTSQQAPAVVAKPSQTESTVEITASGTFYHASTPHIGFNQMSQSRHVKRTSSSS